jgi:hypothetical protein
MRTRDKFDLDGKTPEDLINLTMSKEGENLEFEIDFSPYEIITYRHPHTEDYQKMKSDIKELGFELSDKDEQLWAEWFKNLER